MGLFKICRHGLDAGPPGKAADNADGRGPSVVTFRDFVDDYRKRHAADAEKADTASMFCNGVGERRKPDTFRKPFHTALEAAGIENYRWHDLRHEYGSRPATKDLNVN